MKYRLSKMSYIFFYLFFPPLFFLFVGVEHIINITFLKGFIFLKLLSRRPILVPVVTLTVIWSFDLKLFNSVFDTSPNAVLGLICILYFFIERIFSVCIIVLDWCFYELIRIMLLSLIFCNWLYCMLITVMHLNFTAIFKLFFFSKLILYQKRNSILPTFHRIIFSPSFVTLNISGENPESACRIFYAGSNC